MNVSNVLSEEKKKQVIALGQLGWSLRRIEKATAVRRETAAVYLKAAGIAVRPPGGWGKKAPAKPANEVTTDPEGAKPANEVTTDSRPSAEEKPAAPETTSATTTSVSEPYRELIALREEIRGASAGSIYPPVKRIPFSTDYLVSAITTQIWLCQVQTERSILARAP